MPAALAASHAARLGLPYITPLNADAYPPPSLNSFRSAASRAPDDSPPVLWFWQMTEKDWDRQGHSYEVQKKQYRRLLVEYKQRDKQREKNRDKLRDRSTRKRPAEDRLRRRKQYAAEVKRKRAREFEEARRADRPRRERQALLCQLFDAAGLSTHHLVERCSYDGGENPFTCCVGACVHEQLEPLSQPDAEWVEDLAVKLTRYREFLEAHPSRTKPDADNDDEYLASCAYALAPGSRHKKRRGYNIGEAKVLERACTSWVCDHAPNLDCHIVLDLSNAEVMAAEHQISNPSYSRALYAAVDGVRASNYAHDRCDYMLALMEDGLVLWWSGKPANSLGDTFRIIKPFYHDRHTGALPVSQDTAEDARFPRAGRREEIRWLARRPWDHVIITEGKSRSPDKVDISADTWQKRMANLSRRFPHIPEAQIRAALQDNNGHGGKAALALEQPS